MLRFVVFTALSFIGGSSAGWCDEWGTLEWSDEFTGTKLDTSKWSIVCNDVSAESCGSLPFGTHQTSSGAECRSATCIPDAVTVGDG
jgi:hypothetical protein